MAWRIVVGLKRGVKDARGERIQRELKEHLQIDLPAVRTLDIYTVDAVLSDAEVEQVAAGPFSDPVIQEYAINQPLASSFDMLIEVGFRPGVTDNPGRTAREAIQYLTGRRFAEGEAVYTSTQYLFTGLTDKVIAEKIAADFLANGLIQHWTIISADELAQFGVPLSVPKVMSDTAPTVRSLSLELTDQELLDISRQGMLALNLEEMHKIKRHIADPQVVAERQAVGLGAELTDVELETLAQTWSEHCKHKIFSAKIEYEDEHGNKQVIDSLFKTYIVGATDKVRENLGKNDYCLSVFKDNAGVI
ncbi:MAG: phosphoribosylformylglycinamidine synthase subunit PurS, partial [Desulfuromusa sp.]|nr:phosphoribosylformylglycinamidine synthase subunit PurS [Desulfuromusa sp.]